MGHTEPELRDAYRETAAGVAAERLRQNWLAARDSELAFLMLRPLTARLPAMYAYSASGDDVPVGEDFGAWLAMQGDRDVALAIWSDTDRRRLIEQYCAARARADVNVEDRSTDWRAEALEAAEWTRAGRP